MKSVLAIVFGMTCFLTASGFCGQPAAQLPRFRVGTFDQQALVVAYYRSDINLSRHRDMVAAHAAAVAAGDTKKAKELEKRGADQQALAMQQMLGKAEIDNVMEWTRPLLPEVAAAAKVDVIVIGKVFYPTDAEVVDVTEQYLVALKADAGARKVIDELHAKQKKDRAR